ncbi:MAG TPA: aminotransferase class I/II-fold pyridoxal phosphate-dependent enzyme [Gemmatimonadetes bacterium]|nr:aminotransferase class I/II-fold pyridoxal phosphate-dependent enzyme [Gemmatimonadota bacterium]
MYLNQNFSRRRFMGGIASVISYIGLKPSTNLESQNSRKLLTSILGQEAYDYDSFAKISFNENPYGPSDKVREVMDEAFKYSMRYGYPDGNVQQMIADLHGVNPENILLGAGSGEILKTVGMTYLLPGKKVVGVEPSYAQVYQHASGIKSDSILLPLLDDYRQDIPAMIDSTKRNYRDVGFVYFCNPNNPTGRTVSSGEVRQLLDGIPEDMPILIDEAYHHYVEDPSYATSIPYILEGRKVIVTRTFSKIYGMAGLKIGYAVAPADMIKEMALYCTGGDPTAIARWGAVAALEDTEAEQRVRNITLELRKKTTEELTALGYDVIPSETNFFMVHTGEPVEWVQEEFRKRGVLVGRAFPPLLQHLRVSIGTPDEMDRFMVAWKEIFPPKTAAM